VRRCLVEKGIDNFGFIKHVGNILLKLVLWWFVRHEPWLGLSRINYILISCNPENPDSDKMIKSDLNLD